MAISLRLADVRLAWETQDPELVSLVERLAEQSDDEDSGTPVREGAPTFAKFLAEIRGKPFRRKPRAEQAHYRVEQIKALEAADAEVPLPDRLRLHEVIEALWHDDGPYARSCLLAIIARVKLTYGPWRALKRIFKEAEARGDTEIFGALAARFDAAYANRDHEVSRDTLIYLCRRAWRYLRRTAVTLPACYADLAGEVLAWYPDRTNWSETWVANQIFHHESGNYNRSRFTHSTRSSDFLKERAFADLWKRTPRPLFSLLERARSDRVREFAAGALKADFRASIREIEPSWVACLVDVESRSIDEFVVWILNNVPRFEQAAFRTLGLHDAVLRLFDSASHEARAYAADYARTHARDLPVAELIRLANNGHAAVRGLAGDLLLSRDPRTEVGLEAWGQLLETAYGYELAGAVLRKHFGNRELTPDWFKERLFSPSLGAYRFAKDRLPEVHPYQKLGLDFFRGMIEEIENRPSSTWRAVTYAMGELARFDLNSLDPSFLQWLIVHPFTSKTVADWIDAGTLKANTLPLDFTKMLAFHPAWEADPWLVALKRQYAWARSVEFNEELADRVLGWLRDVRRFSPADLGFDWLFKLVVRSEPRYHDFAVETMIRGFVPADFALEGAAAATPAPASEAVAVDLKGASFLFTGKMATMPRNEAEAKVRQAGGAIASGVTAKLYYLVIGDEGSPLYGNGKKGSKQLKAEDLNNAGANIKIISETAFLKMMAGEQQTFSADTTLAGCERLWEMATAPGPGDAPLAQFAIKYLRRHHPDIALAETDRPVDPGAEIPGEFLTLDRVQPLFAESRKPLREFALEVARWDFARWAPPIEALIALAEVPYPEVRQFVAKALLADESPENRRFRVPPEVLTPTAVYRFCESADESTRDLGMQLIARSPRLRLPEELFRLTESPDRKIRAFVIRAIWSLYRDRGITEGWKPVVPAQSTVGAAAKKAAASLAESRGQGAPARPENLPASPLNLWKFLRRTLFEIPPARPEAVKDQEPGGAERIKPLPARKAKLALVEVMRDLALEEIGFARGVLPLLEEFMTSRGPSERAACLVAVTRIRHAYPDLARPDSARRHEEAVS
ncbi:BRCT domain-containing protein [Singulisphaera sp. Ch08]|uniref:BRCT domain-containing protein n=1 Tax=Singulisphaera sp. Ch08 TaxID=3120278 RepID=A0AAU7CAQ0_9BACT